MYGRGPGFMRWTFPPQTDQRISAHFLSSIDDGDGDEDKVVHNQRFDFGLLLAVRGASRMMHGVDHASIIETPGVDGFSQFHATGGNRTRPGSYVTGPRIYRL